MNVIISRGAGDKPGPEIVSDLLTTREICRFRGVSELNYYYTSRKQLNGDGPKIEVMIPTKLVEISGRRGSKRGILKMYSRTYDKEDGKFTINSHMTIEVQSNEAGT